MPATLTLDQYAVARVQGDVSDSGGHDRTKGVIEGLLVNSYRSMVLAEDAAAAGFKLLARQVWLGLPKRAFPRNGSPRLACEPFEEIDQEVRRRMLDAQAGEPPEVRAVLRAKLGEPPETSRATGRHECAAGKSLEPVKLDLRCAGPRRATLPRSRFAAPLAYRWAAVWPVRVGKGRIRVFP